MRGKRDENTGLYMVNLDDMTLTPPPKHMAAPVVRSAPIEEKVAFWAATMGAPVGDTLLRSARKGFFTCPGITTTDMSRHPPNFTATSKGHMKMRRQGLQPTQYDTTDTDTATNAEVLEDFYPDPPPSQGPGHKTLTSGPLWVQTKCVPVTQQHFTDLAGRFPYKSFTGAEYQLIMFCMDANYIHCETMTSRSGKEYARAYQCGIDFFKERGITVKWERLDNETSKELTQVAKKLDIKIQYAPPNNHRANKAERAIQTWKGHFISILCMTDPDFPMGAWDHLVEHTEFTLNLLRGSHTNPSISAWAHLHGQPQFMVTPIAPAGTKVVVYETPEQRASWSPHGVDGFYVGPALQHYRCYKVYVTKTKRTRIAETLSWHPHTVTMPTSSATDLLHAAVLDLHTALREYSRSPLCTATASQPVQDTRASLTTALRQLSEIFDDTQTAATPPKKPTETHHDGPRTANTAETPAHEEPVCEVEQEIDMVPTTSPPAPRPTLSLPSPPASAATPAPLAPPLSPQHHREAPIQPRRGKRVRQKNKRYGCTALDMDASGAKLRYESAMRSSEGAGWENAANKEFDRLVTETQTGEFIHRHDVPKGRVVSYYNPQLTRKRRPHGIELRIRGTYGGDKGDYRGPTAAETAEITTVKLLLNSTISDPEAEWLTTDICDYYLGTPMDTPEFMRISVKHIPEATMIKYDLAKYVHNGSVIMQLNKGIYGLKQAGRLAQQRLIKHLADHGYHQCTNTPCLFKHETNSVTFTLVVDDFGVKYTGKADADHLLHTLEKLYKIKTNWKGDAYIGFDIALAKCPSTNLRTASLSMPRFLPSALKRFHLEPHKPVHNPIDYQPGARTALQTPTPEDTSPAATPGEAKRIQEIVGVLLYYARALDATFLTAVGKVASAQAKPTRKVLAAAERLLQYAATEPAAQLIFCASKMDLIVHGDASYLSETNARSRGAGVFILGDREQPDILNAPFHCSTMILDVVVAAATEAEYGSAYLNTKQIGPFKNTLEDLGHPQEPTLLFIDNKAAGGIANDTVTQRHSKAMDMRFHLVRDRVRQGQLRVTWAPGRTNLADYLTKAHPTKHFVSMRPFFITTPPSDVQWTTADGTGKHGPRLRKRLTTADIPDPRPPSQRHQ